MWRDFPGSSAAKESTCSAGDPGLIPWVRRFPWRRDRLPIPVFSGFPGGSDCKESTCNVGDPGLIPWVGKLPWRRDRLPIPVFSGFPGGSNSKESTYNVGDLGSILSLGRSSGGGHGNPPTPQYSCLENPHGQRSLAGYSP